MHIMSFTKLAVAYVQQDEVAPCNAQEPDVQVACVLLHTVPLSTAVASEASAWVNALRGAMRDADWPGMQVLHSPYSETTECQQVEFTLSHLLPCAGRVSCSPSRGW